MGFEIGLKNEPCWFLNGHSIRSASVSCEVGALLSIAAEESALLVHETVLQVIESLRIALIYSITRSAWPLNGTETDYLLRQYPIPGKGSDRACSYGIKVNLKMNHNLS
jgi:hypothetical protein